MKELEGKEELMTEDVVKKGVDVYDRVAVVLWLSGGRKRHALACGIFRTSS